MRFIYAGQDLNCKEGGVYSVKFEIHLQISDRQIRAKEIKVSSVVRELKAEAGQGRWSKAQSIPGHSLEEYLGKAQNDRGVNKQVGG